MQATTGARERFEISAIGALGECAQEAPESEILPLLALSICCSGNRAAGEELTAMTMVIAGKMEQAGRPEAALRLLESCVRAFNGTAVAELDEAATMLRWRLRRMPLAS